MSRPTLILNKGADRRLRLGHLWVFSNEIDTAKSPLKNLSAGEAVDVVSSAGDYLGSGYANPATLISVRLLSTSRENESDRGDLNKLLDSRLQTAHALRLSLYKDPWYRLVHAEGDRLPGLIVDRYDDTLIVQISTAGMDQHKGDICQRLAELTGCKNIRLANNLAARELENLSVEEETIMGELPAELVVKENGCDYRVPASGGQKTGWYYDHRENRAIAAKHADGKRVLDVFCYTGAWSMPAAIAGAEQVVAVDSSQKAMAALAENAKRNGVDGKLEAITGDAIETLKQLHADSRRFDVVILDPPAFIKRKKDLKNGMQHYEVLNRLACRLVAENGILITASCSQALGDADLLQIARRSAAKRGLELQVLNRLSQAPDHPALAGVPESFYLNGLVARLC